VEWGLCKAWIDKLLQRELHDSSISSDLGEMFGESLHSTWYHVATRGASNIGIGKSLPWIDQCGEIVPREE
jgi:hypothetical protein